MSEPSLMPPAPSLPPAQEPDDPRTAPATRSTGSPGQWELVAGAHEEFLHRLTDAHQTYLQVEGARGRAARSMLVTGASGVVGVELVEQARRRGWHVVGCSARGGNGSVAWRMGEAEPPAELRRPWTVIVHAAARPRFDLPPDEARAANVGPLLALAPLVSPRTHLVHVSTAYATGLTGGVESADPGDFRNSYEWSKAEAERVASERYGPLTIVRPSIVIGRRSDGAVARFAGPYLLALAFGSGLLREIAGDPAALIDVVPVCAVAECLLDLAEAPRPDTTRVETVGLGGRAPTLAELVNASVAAADRWLVEHGAEPLPEIPIVPITTAHEAGPLAPLLPYLSVREPLPVSRPVTPSPRTTEVCVRWALENVPGLTKAVTAKEPNNR
ncbi:SDR family oxidoreductase [Thermomonospora umbrina]|uniref:Nucleoside-diphosphate-sugar epimerase n=1 Tax=Thermomonospora umbrina TaxID=111806 RepID=A0A3D9SU54_9ACTN|nr:SDR family oxidoreductase [Thermomonospora umbrina]REE95221.1 nucleoside-diphosphate-sugar epimerase [Thermomonospora umbrina]